jgi:hypothetical protein
VRHHYSDHGRGTVGSKAQLGPNRFPLKNSPFSYSYGIETVKRVFDSILGLDYLRERDIELKRIPKQDREIKLPRRHAQAILPSAATIAKAQQTYGFRLQKQFQALLQASALEKGRRCVNSLDVDRVLHLMNWVNFDERPMDQRKPKD